MVNSIIQVSPDTGTSLRVTVDLAPALAWASIKVVLAAMIVVVKSLLMSAPEERFVISSRYLVTELPEAASVT